MKFNHWLPKIITKLRRIIDKNYRLNAIVLLGTIYFYDEEDDVNKKLFKHELKHVEQQEKEGILFYFKYLYEWIEYIFLHVKFKDIISLKRLFNLFDIAYLNISYEIEARKAEND